MLEKLFALVAKAAFIAPALIADVEGTYHKINADPTTAGKIEDALAAALQGLEAFFPTVK